MSDDEAWFAPKAYGYGAGLPIRWQGWAVLGLFLIVAVVAQWLLATRHWLLFALVIGLDVAMLALVAARRTRGGWRWRSGSE